MKGEYEVELDKLIADINADNGMPVDAYHVVLLEFNTRLIAKALDELQEIKEILKGNK